MVPKLACGLLAVLLSCALMATALRPAGWSLTALPDVSAKTAMGAAARALDPGFHTVRGSGNDGQFYWGIAVDPLANGRVHSGFDKASYRYGHPLFGWLGWLFSAGQAPAVPTALAIIGLICMFLAAATAAGLGVARGGVGWEGLLVALNPGLVNAAAHDLGEPLATALLLGTFASLLRRGRGLTWILLALLPLAKEELILVVLAVCVWELLDQRPRRAATLATAAIPALLWWTYARVTLGGWFTTGVTALGAPLAGWGRSLLGAGDRAAVTRPGSRLSEIGIALLAAALLAIVLGSLPAARRRGPIELAYLGLAAVAVCLAANATSAMTTALRNTAFVFALLPFVIATPRLSRAPSRVFRTSVRPPCRRHRSDQVGNACPQAPAPGASRRSSPHNA
jgi:hypothetical protein